MNMPKVSVLLCTYNREKLLRESVNSIVGQTFQDFELMIVDDGSTDDTRKLLESYRDSRIRIFFQEKNEGYCRTANRYLPLARGTYIAFATSDDIWEREKLEKQMEYMEEHPECGACFTYSHIIDENGRDDEERFPSLVERFRYRFDTRKEWIRYFFRYGNCVSFPSSLVPRTLVEKVGFFNLLYFQGADLDLWMNIVRMAPIYILPIYLTKYRMYHNPDDHVSGATRIKTARFMNEHMIMRRKLLESMDDVEFIRVFKEDFKNKDSQSELELQIERAFLLMECVEGLPRQRVLGMEKFEEIFCRWKEEALVTLEEMYGTSLKQIYAWNLEHFYVDFGTLEEKAELSARVNLCIADMETVKKDLEMAVAANGRQREQIRSLETRISFLEKEKEAAESEKTRMNGEKETLLKWNSETERENKKLLSALERQVIRYIKLKEDKGMKCES